jgi:hypothetical protein
MDHLLVALFLAVVVWVTRSRKPTLEEERLEFVRNHAAGQANEFSADLDIWAKTVVDEANALWSAIEATRVR